MNNYYDQNEMYNNMKVEGNFNKTATLENTSMEMPVEGMESCHVPAGCEPIYEAPQERVCHRYINYEVPHIIPCNTRIVNHHVYRHTYSPCYSCCEENVVCNVYDKKCC